ncbi:DUF1007 family protein [Enterobacter hormaechei]|uniref:DUF1007 family protein n=1 Tax=Enterobacter hormaechei TaxID=158836 RepID=A0A331W3G0_9ENTR|nr:MULTISPECIES: DUF1007 family protein [Enterobacter]MBE4899414.1 DUF1007 family protein [Enterobacter cloacae complex sp. P8RS]MBT2005320.1 DUF1007 family protein [Enterobacter hormaechei subsp. xiangfangensis]EGQ5290758.1 DUF1007 family protein [Enterobacter hormaechei]ELC6296283.1 DUF1007 family protein [Enterobacter hormaechei]ELC6541802.1 DUF1007 family protein [Enterobacter hormaechei]
MQIVKQSAVALFLAVFTFAAGAHPHSFISLKTELVTDGTQLSGLKMRWTMDEITSADLLYDAGNAKPGDEIWKKLAAEVMANVLGQHYFTEFWHNGQKVKFLNRPTVYGMTRDGHQAVLTFILPLAHPQPLAGQKYRFSTFDPTYYVDMRYDNDSDVRLPDALQKSCKIAVHTPKPSEEMLNFAVSLDKEDAPPEDMELGKQFAQEVTLQCQ